MKKRQRLSAARVRFLSGLAVGCLLAIVAAVPFYNRYVSVDLRAQFTQGSPQPSDCPHADHPWCGTQTDHVTCINGATLDFNADKCTYQGVTGAGTCYTCLPPNPCPSGYPLCGTQSTATCQNGQVPVWEPIPQGANAATACYINSFPVGLCYTCANNGGTSSSGNTASSSVPSSAGGGSTSAGSSVSSSAACAASNALSGAGPGAPLSQYYSLNQRTVGAPSGSLNLGNTTALCDVGDLAISGNGVIATCASCGPQMLEFNGHTGTATQDGWTVYLSYAGDKFYDTAQTTVECLHKTPQFDPNFIVYHVVNDGGDLYSLNQNRSVALCKPGDKAIGGSGNPTYCDQAPNPACGKTQTLVFNGVVTQGNQEGWKVVYDVDGGSNDTQHTEVTCLGLKPGAGGGTCGNSSGNSSAATACKTICGDKILAGTEECDDGNTIPNDGCSSSCTKESGTSSSGQSSRSSSASGTGNGSSRNSSSSGGVCGNKIVEPPEQCDDGNALPNDGCSASCMFEQCTLKPPPPPGCTAASAGSASINRTCAASPAGFGCQGHQSPLTLISNARVRGVYTWDVAQKDLGFGAPGKMCGTATLTFSVDGVVQRVSTQNFNDSTEPPSVLIFDLDLTAGSHAVAVQAQGVLTPCASGASAVPTTWKGSLSFDVMQCSGSASSAINTANSSS